MASTENLFGFKQIQAGSGVDTTLIFEEINKQLEEYLLEKYIDTNSTDNVLDFLEMLSNHAQEDFDELIGEYTDKEWFIKALMCIFTLLFNANFDTADKIKRLLTIAIETTLKIWQGQK